MDALEMKRISHCGTEGYFAPEMLSNAEYGTAVDVFSLGCILCEIVCGRFMGDAKLKVGLQGFCPIATLNFLR